MHIHLGVIGDVIFFFIAWIIISIPIWLSAKFFSSKDSFGKALIASLASVLIFEIIVGIFDFIHLHLIGLILGFIGMLGVFKAIFDVGWLGALGIAILSFIIAFVIIALLAIIGLSIPLLI
ncbi:MULTISPECIES: hypothetical protein [Acidianus]|uniref:Uncharacterized protein n=1 Tax=Candidatus Acidianus copahuensis TaxID=1160895 RepID=A0A031LKM9_9CREN|nr:MULTISPECIES: hypothetical protein [Acidianus]EZQ02050.1 hypothetical protein CM19_11300 [Candidatus Acidianus copahuensis]NON63311.1 hypothetical protein [Acidianus sp. RZ1]